jgi:IclR family pca regulon transcriptional regulator
VNSVAKAMRVLTAFDGSQREMSLSSIARETGLDMSSAQRFTYTLAELGYLKKDLESRTYQLSPKVFDFVYQYLASNALIYRATPYLLSLSRESTETTNITVLDGTDIVFVMRIASQHLLNPNVIVGSRLPAYCTAPGLAMLSQFGRDEVDSLLQHSELKKHTASTVVDPKAIKARLTRIRAAGYAHTEEEYFLGDISTAAAILDGSGRPVGAINVAVERPRWKGVGHEQRLAALVISAAASISGRR